MIVWWVCLLSAAQHHDDAPRTLSTAHPPASACQCLPNLFALSNLVPAAPHYETQTQNISRGFCFPHPFHKHASGCPSTSRQQRQVDVWSVGVAFQITSKVRTRTVSGSRSRCKQPRTEDDVSLTVFVYRIPLNDDAEESRQRMNSRKALQEKHYNSIKAAASTPRKSSVRLEDVENASPGGDPRTPRGSRPPGDDDDDDTVTVGGISVTPMKRVPILANFEEWMKMATDNKINATNSWNFALIDYFHDMSLLKEGEGINFQKASCTLDGCVKIYTNRIDSVATETGKLLSGLADSNANKKKDREEGEESDDEELDEDGNPKKKPKKKVNSLGTPKSNINLPCRSHIDPKSPWHHLSTRYS